MILMSSRALGLALAASLLLAGPAFAQTAATPAPSAKAAPAAKTAKPRSAASIECSKQADAKGLHGKERKKFRSECMKEAKAGGAAPATK